MDGSFRQAPTPAGIGVARAEISRLRAIRKPRDDASNLEEIVWMGGRNGPVCAGLGDGS
jgi:hypothetical protein